MGRKQSSQNSPALAARRRAPAENSGAWDQGDGGSGSGRNPRRRRRFDAAQLQLVLLKLIADQPRHGYELIRAIEEMTHGTYVPSPGVVYPNLSFLQEMSLIEEAPSTGTRKEFLATREGRVHLKNRAEDLARVLACLCELGEDRRKASEGPAARAVRNLLAALWTRVTQGNDDEERLHRIAEILDKATQQIERLK